MFLSESLLFSRSLGEGGRELGLGVWRWRWRRGTANGTGKCAWDGMGEKRTRVSRPSKNSFPAADNSTPQTEISHPASLRATLAPRARPTIWWPKQTPMTRMEGRARALVTKSTRARIQGGESKALCPVRKRGEG